MKIAASPRNEKCFQREEAGSRPLIQRLERERESGSPKATDRLKKIIDRMNRSLSTYTYSQAGRHPHGV